MSCFKLPKWVLNRIDAMRRQFLWSRNEGTRAIHLINWQIVCLPKQCGGMGVANLYLQNIALLLRWLWRLYGTDYKLWATYVSKIHGIRYDPDGPLIFWKALLKLRPIFSSSVRVHVLSGRKVSLWFDPWNGMPMAEISKETLPHRTISLWEAKHSAATLFPRPHTHLLDQVTHSLTNFNPTHGDDKFTWALSASGCFSVNSIYKVLSQGGKLRFDKISIWKAAVTPSMQVFFFLFLHNRLLTHEIMQKRNLSFQPGCVMCECGHPEDAMHLFFSCPYATTIWQTLSAIFRYNVLTVDDAISTTYQRSIPRDKDRRRSWTTAFITTVWVLWRERNERTFRDIKCPVAVLLNKIRQETELYLKHC